MFGAPLHVPSARGNPSIYIKCYVFDAVVNCHWGGNWCVMTINYSNVTKNGMFRLFSMFDLQSSGFDNAGCDFGVVSSTQMSQDAFIK